MERNVKIKKAFFIVVLLFMLMPILQSRYRIFSEAPAHFYQSEVPSDPNFSINHWKYGNFQKEKEAHLHRVVGFKNSFIRLYNQCLFSFYHKINVSELILGSGDELYQNNYVYAYLGEDFVGHDSIRKRVEKLQYIVDNLKKKNTEVIVLLAPGKAAFYPELLPESYLKRKKEFQNVEVYKEELAKTGIHTFDVHSWFVSMKETVHKEHKLYPKNGTHWSYYGEVLVADSLIRLIEQVTNTKLPEFKITEIEKSKKLRYRDNDVGNMLNLIFPIEDHEMSYPKVEIIESEGREKKLNALAIGDSYLVGYYDDYFGGGFLNKIFKRTEFWHYFEEVIVNNRWSKARTENLDLMKELKERDLLLIVSTDFNIWNFGFGFINRYYSMLKDQENEKD